MIAAIFFGRTASPAAQPDHAGAGSRGLMTMAAEADVFQRRFAFPRIDPEGEDALSARPNWPAAASTPQAVDADGEAEVSRIRRPTTLRREFRRAVKATRANRGE